MLNLNIYAVEGDAHTETAECLMMRGSLQHHELLEEMGTETIAAVIHVLIIEIVVNFSLTGILSPNVPTKLYSPNTSACAANANIREKNNNAFFIYFQKRSPSY